jgi:hypothetical protein
VLVHPGYFSKTEELLKEGEGEKPSKENTDRIFFLRKLKRKIFYLFKKGVNPAIGSPTATLLDFTSIKSPRIFSGQLPYNIDLDLLD